MFGSIKKIIHIIEYKLFIGVAGNKYRMICKYHFGITRIHLFIKWIGSHAEYTKLCESNEQYTVNIY